ncbi:hypothetical protein [Novosphingopyxis sp. YJ-S2-01]|uniref:hypothetical protein n=1 Tax=Novosphingopyxis sp. YJ-S2-01 TaxID=2794021 RepID=UPI0018DD0CC8|nr:hypothetical protein [Novosphingopyxis sp. YJ-S2-01]MBH9537163.1 hypothetical protein [Novosphingopyxis sp. YJ-S2-01]
MTKSLPLISVAALGLSLAACSVDKTEEGEAPELNVEADAGQLPEYDVDTADVNVGTETTEVAVPEVDVTTDKEKVTVPDINVEPADQQ